VRLISSACIPDPSENGGQVATAADDAAAPPLAGRSRQSARLTAIAAVAQAQA
jgi:hypothetical protein